MIEHKSFSLIHKLKLSISLSSYLNTIYPIFSVILIEYHMHQASFPTLKICEPVLWSITHLVVDICWKERGWKEGRRSWEKEGGREGKRRKTDLWAGCFSQHPPLPSLPLQIQFSHSVVSNSLRPHGLQHARLTCPLPAPRACSNSFVSN